MEVLATGYPSLDYITPVSRSPDLDETAIVKDLTLEPTFGGCGANIATGLAIQGFDTGVSMVVGEDFSETGYREYLVKKGVDISGVVMESGAFTSRSYIYLNPEGGYQNFFFPGAAGRFSSKYLDTLDFESPEYALVTVGNANHNLEFLNKVKGSRTKLIWQLKADSDAYKPEEIEDFARASWAIFMNQVERDYLLDCLNLDSIEALLEADPELIFLTKGDEGSTVISQNGREDIPTVEARGAVDPTGAGDAFTTGVLSGLLRSYSPKRSAQMGAVLASFAVEQFGAQSNLPNYDTLNKRYNEFFEVI